MNKIFPVSSNLKNFMFVLHFILVSNVGPHFWVSYAKIIDGAPLSLLVTKNVLRCQGQNLKALLAAPCDTTSNCEEKLNCFSGDGGVQEEDKNCHEISHLLGLPCQQNGVTSENCMQLEIPNDETTWAPPGSGLVVCQSVANDSANMTKVSSKVDYIVRDDSNHYRLASEVTVKDVITIGVRNRFSEDKEIMDVWCLTFPFFLTPNSTTLNGIMMSGVEFKLDDVQTFASYSYYVQNLTVPHDLVGFSCRAEWLQNNTLGKTGMAIGKFKLGLDGVTTITTIMDKESAAPGRAAQTFAASFLPAGILVIFLHTLCYTKTLF